MAEYSKSEAMDWARENLRGQWTTIMTPFTPDDELDEDGLRHNVRHIRSLGTQGGGQIPKVANPPPCPDLRDSG